MKANYDEMLKSGVISQSEYDGIKLIAKKKKKNRIVLWSIIGCLLMSFMILTMIDNHKASVAVAYSLREKAKSDSISKATAIKAKIDDSIAWINFKKDNPKAYQIYIKHPDWSRSDCEWALNNPKGAKLMEKNGWSSSDCEWALKNPKAAKLMEKHPKWSTTDCEDIISHKIWVGMKYDMLVAERGNPDHVNTSNYGNGVEYQCCWSDRNPSCFYMKSDNIITAYN